jgi:hypothetical protein
MYRLLYVAFGAAALAEFLTTSYKGSGFPILPGPLKFLPELLSGVYAGYVVGAGLRTRFYRVPVRYLAVFGAIAVIILCGVLANDVASGPILAGMRYYLRGIPFFFLPAVISIGDGQLRRYLYFVLGLSFLQVPLSLYQRYALESSGHDTGDGVMGTVMDSGGLTLFLISAMCVLTAAMVRGRISKVAFTIMFVILLIPISINETKITAVLLPPALLATLLTGSEAGKRVRVFVTALGLLVISGAIYVPLYNYFNELNKSPDEQFTIAQVFTEEFLSSYLDTKSQVGKATVSQVGRVDALVVPLQILSADPVRFAFGFGIGNASSSNLGPSFSGKYYDVYGPFVVGFSSGTFLLELGVFGFALILLLHGMILRDALTVARQGRGFPELIAVAWVGTSFVIICGIFYTAPHVVELLNYCYWFFSGVVATRRTTLLQEQKAY